MKRRYIFRVGALEPFRKVTVRAKDREQAFAQARRKMDRRVEEAGGEPPVGWDLSLVEEMPL